MKIARCRICGCTDNHACEGGCTWLEVDRDAGEGICSNCGPDNPRAALILSAEWLEDYAEILRSSHAFRKGSKWCWGTDAETRKAKHDHDQMRQLARSLRRQARRLLSAQGK